MYSGQCFSIKPSRSYTELDSQWFSIKLSWSYTELDSQFSIIPSLSYTVCVSVSNPLHHTQSVVQYQTLSFTHSYTVSVSVSNPLHQTQPVVQYQTLSVTHSYTVCVSIKPSLCVPPQPPCSARVCWPTKNIYIPVQKWGEFQLISIIMGVRRLKRAP